MANNLEKMIGAVRTTAGTDSAPEHAHREADKIQAMASLNPGGVAAFQGALSEEERKRVQPAFVRPGVLLHVRGEAMGQGQDTEKRPMAVNRVNSSGRALQVSFSGGGSLGAAPSLPSHAFAKRRWR